MAGNFWNIKTLGKATVVYMKGVNTRFKQFEPDKFWFQIS